MKAVLEKSENKVSFLDKIKEYLAVFLSCTEYIPDNINWEFF